MDGVTMQSTHALTIDNVRPGGLAAMQEVAKAENIAGRSLVGCWTSEFGRLNQLYRLWRVESGDAGVSALARPEVLLNRDERVLSERRPTVHSNDGPWFYELRSYQMHAGRVNEFVDLLLAHMELRETWSKCIGLWLPLNGDMSEVIHLWPYRDLAHRAQTRATSAAHPVWDAYRKKVLPMIAGQTSVLLSPTALSRLR
jgi:hypothetical protein